LGVHRERAFATPYEEDLMRITKIETIPVRVGVDRRVETTDTKGFRFQSKILLVLVHTDEGLVGLGEANGSPDWSGETCLGTKDVIDHHFAPALSGEDPRRISHCMRKLVKTHGHPFGKAALEMALFDLLGKALGVPLSTLLGGAVRDAKIPLRFPLFPVDPSSAGELARKVVQEGVATVKAKVGRDPMEVDLERVAAVRDAVGPKVRVTVDANGGWSVADTLRIAPHLASLGVAFIEQPVDRYDLDALAYVRARAPLPIMADESVFSLKDALTCLQKDAADIIAIYPGKNGGIAQSVAIAAAAEARGVHCAIGSNLEWDIASAVMGHVAIAIENVQVERYGADIIGTNFHVERAVTTTIASTLGSFTVPAGPGIGVDLDFDAIESLRL
jgi:L-alanine-DL-glutamate epimerase-like enolase superfamily enzyme